MTPASRRVDAGLERTGSRCERAVLELGGVLAQVPDGAALVLGVPVEGILDDVAMLADGVAHDPGADTVGDRLRPVGDRDDDVLRGPLLIGFAVAPPSPGGIGHQRLSILVVNSAGSRWTRSLPRGRPPCRPAAQAGRFRRGALDAAAAKRRRRASRGPWGDIPLGRVARRRSRCRQARPRGRGGRRPGCRPAW